jgi:hypothetical protein
MRRTYNVLSPVVGSFTPRNKWQSAAESKSLTAKRLQSIIHKGSSGEQSYDYPLRRNGTESNYDGTHFSGNSGAMNLGRFLGMDPVDLKDVRNQRTTMEASFVSVRGLVP